jgi:hypothetical protein
MSAIGIDKLVLTTRDFRIGDSRLLNHAPPMVKAIDRNTGIIEEQPSSWLRDSQGREINGKLYLNHPEYMINVDKFKGLNLIFNPSVITGKGKLNYLATDEKDISRCRVYLEKLCEELTIEASLNDMRVSRLDYAKDRSDMIHPPEAYVPVMKLLDAKRMKSTKEYSGETFTIGNSNRQIQFYNRGKKVAIDTGNNLGFDVSRLEARFVKTKEVSSRLNIVRFNDVCDSNRDKWSLDYHKLLNDDLFRSKIDFENLELMAIYTEAEILKEAFNSNWNDYAMTFSAIDIMNRVGGIENLKLVLSEGGVSRATQYRIIQKMRDRNHKASFLRQRRSINGLSELYHEFYDKFAKAI